jgi:hypothetical protein
VEAWLLVAWPVLMGLVAVGALLLIKTVRRTQGTRDPRYTEVVPVKPMSPLHAQRLRRRYAVAAAIIAVLLIVAAFAVA